RIWIRTVSALSGAAPADTGQPKLRIAITSGFAPPSIMGDGHTTLLPRIGSSKHSAANIRSTLPRLWRMLSAAPAPKSGLNTARDFLYSIREFSPGAVRRYYASTASTTAFFRLPTCIYCSSMAIPRPLASFPAVIWEEEEHSRWSWLG